MNMREGWRCSIRISVRSDPRHTMKLLVKSPWNMLGLLCSSPYFPLALTLSLREREQQASDRCLAGSRWAHSDTGVIKRQWTILPLPRREGWGEGNPDSE